MVVLNLDGLGMVVLNLDGLGSHNFFIFFLQTIPRRLIASVDLYFHFFGLCLVLGQNSLSLHVM